VRLASSFSLLGALAILCSWFFPETRSPTRRLVIILSIADIISSQTYLWPIESNQILCQVQAVVSSHFTTTSFWLTALIGIHLYLSIKRNLAFAERCTKYLIMFCLAYPTVTSVVLILTHRTGRLDSLPWCFIPKKENDYIWMILRIAVIYGPLWICWILTIVFYILTKREINRTLNRTSIVTRGSLKEFSIQRKLTFIPIVFALIRLPGTIHRVLNMLSSKDYFPLALLQSIGDPLQGFANGIMYVLFTKKVRECYISAFKRIFCCYTARPVNSSCQDDDYSAPIVDANTDRNSHSV